MRVKAIRPAGAADVYNLEVEETHDFAVESGIIVHNCYDELRYVCMKNPISPPPAAEPKVRPYSPLDTEADRQHDHYEFYRRY